jgi:hypothetical protein
MEEIDRHREVSDRAAVVPVSCLTREFCELQKLSADSLLASRLSHRPPPMMTNHSHDRVLRQRWVIFGEFVVSFTSTHFRTLTLSN